MKEKEDLAGVPAAIGMVILTILFLGLVFAIYPGWNVVGEFLGSNLLLTSEAPAWVQAVGSVAGIFLAVWLPWRQRKIIELERKESEKNLAQISALKAVINLRSFSACVSGFIDAINLADDYVPGEGARKFILSAVDALELPNEESMIHLSNLPHYVHLNIIRLAADWRQGRALLFLNCMPGNGDESIRNSFKTLLVLYSNLLKCSEVCEKQLRNYLEVECGLQNI